MTGAEALVEALERQGVEVIFGIPGGVVLPLFDALYKSKKIKVILTRHEQGAVHAADGYARVTGKVGVCLATSGPGATNLVTGICNAWMDSVPIVALTGQVNTTLLGRDSFQEADIFGITMPITKHSYLVKTPEMLTRSVAEAFYIAGTGRPGPVLIDLPADICAMEYKFKHPEAIELRGYKPTITGHKQQIKKAAKVLQSAKRPLLYVGGGVIIAEASEELKTLALRMDIPVTNTLMGKGAFPESHDLALGMLGMHGTWYANKAISNADVVMAVGVRFDDRVTGRIESFASNARIIHIDVDPAEIAKNVPVEIPIVGNAKSILAEMLMDLKAAKHDEWNLTLKQWKAEHPLSYKDSDTIIKPEYVVEQIYKITGGKAIVCTEVGQNQMWAAQYYLNNEPRTWLSSGGLGTMGYGFPAAIGAQVGQPDALVIDVAGDGSIQMNIQELATAVQNKLPVKIVILNNGYLGMVRQWQQMFFDRRYASSELRSGNPDFAKVAQAYGAEGHTVTEKKDVIPVLRNAFKNKNTCIIDIHVEREQNVMPMVPKGASLDEMITEWED
jgi:acetolactate synthase-1/2/3 large subunit